jgi:hypothetical protein
MDMTIIIKAMETIFLDTMDIMTIFMTIIDMDTIMAIIEKVELEMKRN